MKEPEWSKTCPDEVGWWWWSDGKSRALPTYVYLYVYTNCFYVITRVYPQFVTDCGGYWKRLPDPDAPETESGDEK